MVDRNKICYAFVMLLFYVSAGACFGLALIELYRSYTYVSRQCRVNSVDIKRYRKTYNGLWKVTVMDEDKRRDVLVAEPVRSILREDQNYKVNKTYTCYGPLPNQNSVLSEHWQWKKPSKGLGYFYILCVVINFIGGTIFLTQIKSWICCKTNPEERHQQELQTPLRNEEEQRAAASFTI